MVVVATHCLSAQGLWPEVETGECLVEDLGKVQVSARHCFARNPELVCLTCFHSTPQDSY